MSSVYFSLYEKKPSYVRAYQIREEDTVVDGMWGMYYRLFVEDKEVVDFRSTVPPVSGGWVIKDGEVCVYMTDSSFTRILKEG